MALAPIPDAFIHEPWRMPEALQRATGVRTGHDHPAPTVDHTVAAREARQRLTVVRRELESRTESRDIQEKMGSRRGAPPTKGPSSPQGDLGF